MKTIKYMGDDYTVIGENEGIITAVQADGIITLLQISFVHYFDRLEVDQRVIFLTDENMRKVEEERRAYHDAFRSV